MRACSACALVSGTAWADRADVQVLSDSGNRIVLEYAVKGYSADRVTIAGGDWLEIRSGDESRLQERGAPALPVVNRSVIIPGDGRMEVRVLEARFHDVGGIDVAPSKGVIMRPTSPASVPYQLGPVYGVDAFYPRALASLREPHILRNLRGAVVELHPFQYNPVRRVLRVYDRVVVEVIKVGPGGANVLAAPGKIDSSAFAPLYQRHFLNYEVRRRNLHYDPLFEQGEMLVICADEWLANLAPFVDHKKSIGIATTLVPVSEVGNSASAINAYIREKYATGNLAFVLLVGDAAQVAPGSGGSASDPSYAKQAGSDDYPDLLVGRFSAQSAAHVDTQVARTIHYETLPATTQPWFRKAVGVASAEGPGDDGEYDYEHIANIREDLLGYGYTQVDHIVDPGASLSALRAALDDGRGFVNYTGHGWQGGWASTGFESGDMAGLHNTGKLPFIVTVGCNVGEFHTGTAFAEVSLRATQGGDAVGAIGHYASVISQAWNPPMSAQDEIVDLLVADAYFSFGALAFAGSARMMDDYGGSGANEFDAWHVFGDPSVRVYGTAKPADGLWVTPSDDLAAAGEPGGPFAPASVDYVLENNSEFAIDYQVTGAPGWLVVEPAAGGIGANQSVTVNLRLADGAPALSRGAYRASLAFTNTTDHMGDTERRVSLAVGGPELVQDWPLDVDPGWTIDGEWAFGQPLGQGGEHGSSDPSSGHTGQFVYGYNLAGDYQNDMSAHHLTSEAIDCTDLSGVTLKFWRWLGVESSQYDRAAVEASTDGQEWRVVWKNGAEMSDTAWVQAEIDISAVADGQPQVYLRWAMGDTDRGYRYCGWNLDDIEIWAMQSQDCWDLDGDGHQDASCGGDDCDDANADVGADCDGEPPDGGGGPGGDDDGVGGGCGCRSSRGADGALLVLAALFLVARRRRCRPT